MLRYVDSVIVDLVVGPAPAGSTNEGDAARTVEQIQKQAATRYIGDYEVSI